MKKLFIILCLISIPAFAQYNADLADVSQFYDMSKVSNENYSIIRIQNDKGEYIDIKTHKNGSLYINKNIPMNKAAKMFFNEVIKNQVQPCK